jgi:hypothetical protein
LLDALGSIAGCHGAQALGECRDVLAQPRVCAQQDLTQLQITRRLRRWRSERALHRRDIGYA